MSDEFLTRASGSGSISNSNSLRQNKHRVRSEQEIGRRVWRWSNNQRGEENW